MMVEAMEGTTPLLVSSEPTLHGNILRTYMMENATPNVWNAPNSLLNSGLYPKSASLASSRISLGAPSASICLPEKAWSSMFALAEAILWGVKVSDLVLDDWVGWSSAITYSSRVGLSDGGESDSSTAQCERMLACLMDLYCCSD